MATLKTITGKLTGPDGQGIACVVKAVLSQAVTVPGSQELVPNAKRVYSDPTTGVFTLQLYANNDLTPNGTYFTVTAIGEVDSVPVVGTWIIIVPQTAGPFEISNLVTTPSPVNVPVNGHVASLLVDGAVTFSAGPVSLPAQSIADAALSSKVVLTDTPQTLSGVKHFNGGATFDAGTVSFAVAPSFSAGASFRQYIFLPGPSGGDDFSVINTPLSVAKNYVVASDGSYRSSASLTPAGSTTLEGRGFSAELNNANYPQWNPTTEIKWNNASGAPMIIPAANSSGITLRNFGLDGNAQATKGIYGDRLNASVIENVGVKNLVTGANAVALHLDATNNAVNQNASRNRITSFYFMADEGIRLTGSNPGAYGVSDCCHNLFEHISGSFGNGTNNNNGITEVDADNNTFVDVFLYRNSGTGYGIDLQAGARGEYFFHVQASAGGVHAATPYTVGVGNLIVGYDRENGQPLPVVDANAILDWTESGRNAAGWAVKKFQGPMQFAGKVTLYNNVATAGIGLAAVVAAPAPSLGQTAANANLAQITTPNDGVKHIYLITGFIRINVLGSGSFSLEVQYTDTGGSFKTSIIPLCTQTGVYATVANTADTYSGTFLVSANPNTAITGLTGGAGAVFTGCTYAAGVEITQIL